MKDDVDQVVVVAGSELVRDRKSGILRAMNSTGPPFERSHALIILREISSVVSAGREEDSWSEVREKTLLFDVESSVRRFACLFHADTS